MQLTLSTIIPKPHWQFPLSNKLFEKLMLTQQYDLKCRKYSPDGFVFITDFDGLFRTVIEQMVKGGVKFFSPSGSYERRFMFWFNGHFWHNMEFEYDIKIDEIHFKNIYQLAVYNFVLPTIEFANSPSITITESDRLTDLGKEFIKAIPPFKTYKGTINFNP